MPPLSEYPIVSQASVSESFAYDPTILQQTLEGHLRLSGRVAPTAAREREGRRSSNERRLSNLRPMPNAQCRYPEHMKTPRFYLGDGGTVNIPL